MSEALKLSEGFKEMKDSIKEKVKNELEAKTLKLQSQKTQQQMRFFLNYKIKH